MMDLTDAALREQARQQIQDTVLSYLRENRHLEHVVDEIMLEVDRIGIALRDAARAEQREADARHLRVEFGVTGSFMDRIRRAIEFSCLCRPGEPITTSCKGHQRVAKLIVAVMSETLEERAAAIRGQGEK